MVDERAHKNNSAEILYEIIRMLEKENQCLKNEQVVVEMLITNDKSADEWKTVKTKSKNNTNIASPSSVSPKYHSPVNLQNRFENLIVTAVKRIEILEPQNHTPTNHHRDFEITIPSLNQEQKKVIYTAFVHLMQ